MIGSAAVFGYRERREEEWSKWSKTQNWEEEAGLRSQGGICFHATGDAVRVEKTDMNG